MTRTPLPRRLIAMMLIVVGADALANRWNEPVTAEEVEPAILCTDERPTMALMKTLGPRLNTMVAAGLGTRAALTEVKDSNRPVLDYVPNEPFVVLGQRVAGLTTNMGMLPAVTAIFDAPMETLLERYRAAGHEFRCSVYDEAGADIRMCEAQRPAGWFSDNVLTLTVGSGRTLLPAGRSVVACTVFNKNWKFR